ncbi:MAG: hypothetical protein FJ098_14810, partial [Deltaproteobacteria bacterium]|nr:hypothetical protein [Deltaproteobacteria bacterium]
QITETYQELCRERDLLQAELETLRRSPENLHRAREELSMRNASPEHTIHVQGPLAGGEVAP